MAYDINKCPTFGELTRWSYGFQFNNVAVVDGNDLYITFSPDFTESSPSDVSDFICGDIYTEIDNQGTFQLIYEKDPDFILANFTLHINHKVNVQTSSYELCWDDIDMVTIPIEVTVVHMMVYYTLGAGIFSWFHDGNEYSKNFNI